MAPSQAKNPQSILSALIKELRENAGATQAELAMRLKVTQSFVSKYESGERRLDFVEVNSICIALNTDIEHFSAEFVARMRGQS